MTWVLDILTTIALFSSLVFGINPAEEERIRNLYANNYEQLSELYDTINPCEDITDNPELKVFKPATREGLSITLDDTHYFKIPALFECMFGRSEGRLYLMITAIKNEMRFLNVYQDGNKVPVRYTTDNVLSVRCLRSNFLERPKEISRTQKFYSDIKDNTSYLRELCKEYPNKYPALLRGPFETLNVEIIHRKFDLHLTSMETFKIPGVLACKNQYSDNRMETIFYVLDCFGNKFQVYETRTIMGNQAYALDAED